MQTVRPEEDPFAAIPSAAQGLKGDLLPAARKARTEVETKTKRRYTGGYCGSPQELAKLLNGCVEKYGSVELVGLFVAQSEGYQLGYLIARKEGVE